MWRIALIIILLLGASFGIGFTMQSAEEQIELTPTEEAVAFLAIPICLILAMILANPGKPGRFD